MNDIFKTYRRRLGLIGFVKALLLCSVLGLTVGGIAALVSWFTEMEVAVVLGLSLGLLGGIVFLGTPAVFLKFFRPTDAYVAEQLDALGLEERAVTMRELEGDTSELAALQREDAKMRIVKLPAKRLRFGIAVPLLALFGCSLVFCASFTTVSALAAQGVIAHGDEVGRPADGTDGETQEEEVYYTVTYSVFETEEGKGGSVEGECVQIVKRGGFTDPVTAVADKGFVFIAWVDKDMRPVGNQDRTRNDLNVREDTEIFALFHSAEEEPPTGDDDPVTGGEGEMGGGDEGDEKEGEDGKEGEGGQGGQEGEGGETDEGGSASGGRENNKVIDGTQDYKENFDREQYEKELAEDTTLPDDLKGLLGDYYSSLKP